MNASGPDPVETRIEVYLAEVGALLPGPRAHRRRILDELRDGLHESLHGGRNAGLPTQQAADAATAEFGDPRTVAAAFTGELAVAYARRTLLGLLATGPLIGACWLLALRLSPWQDGAVMLLATVPVLPLVSAAVVLAVRTIATTGSLIRWLPETGSRSALTATAVVATLAIVADAAAISRFAWTHPRASTAATIAVTVSLARALACAVILCRVLLWPLSRRPSAVARPRRACRRRR
ncbi:MAG: hypothetical protein ABW156_02920 [Jiangellaceae bacterium]